MAFSGDGGAAASAEEAEAAAMEVAAPGDGAGDRAAAAAAEAEDAAAASKRRRLDELEAGLRAPDAIMEPGVLDAVAAYLEAGGQPADVVESLSDGYVGYAQMASLVSDWLAMLSGPRGGGSGGGGGGGRGDATAATTAAATTNALSSSVVDEFDLLRELVLARFDPQAVARASEEAAAAASDPSSCSSSDPDAALAALCGDARGRALILQLLLRSGSGGAAGGGIGTNTTTSNRPCPPLGRAVERMLESGGRAAEEEVAACRAGPALAPYLGAFQRYVCGRLAAFLERARAADRQGCEVLARELRAACCGSLHAYLLAQSLVAKAAAAADNEGGGEAGDTATAAARRLSQELELDAAARHGAGSVWPLRRMYAREGFPQATALVGEVLASAGEWRPPLERHRPAHQHHHHHAHGSFDDDAGAGFESRADHRDSSRTPPPAAPPPPIQRAARPLQRLVELYACGGGNGGSPPPLAPLRHPELLDLLLAAVFSATPAAPAASAELRACRRLLALALAGGGGEEGQKNKREASHADEGASLRSLSPSHDANAPQDPTAEELELVIEAAAALTARCAAQGPGAGQNKPRPGAREFAAAERACAASPALALAIARVARGALGAGGTYADDRCALSAAALLELLRVGARAYPRLCGPLAISGVDAALRASARTGRGLEVGRLALALLLEVIVSACAAPLSSSSDAAATANEFAPLGPQALDLAVRWAGGEPDAPLLRQFALALLSCAQPPFSPQFCASALRLVLAARLVGRSTAAGGGAAGGARTAGLSSEQRASLVALARECRALRPPLRFNSGEERVAFDDLCRALGV